METVNKIDIAVKELCDKNGIEAVLNKIKKIECTKHGKKCFPDGISYDKFEKNPLTGIIELKTLATGITLNNCDTLRELVAKELEIDSV